MIKIVHCEGTWRLDLDRRVLDGVCVETLRVFVSSCLLLGGVLRQ
jgi:hypothetical protein